MSGNTKTIYGPNIAPDGRHYPFGRIIANHLVGRHLVTEVEGDGGRSFVPYHATLSENGVQVAYPSFNEALLAIVLREEGVGLNSMWPFHRFIMSALRAEKEN